MALANLEIDIALQPKQLEFLRGIDAKRELLFGGGRGGGKSRGLRSVHLIRRIRFAKSKGTIWRRTYPELERNHIRPLFVEHPQLRQFYNEQKRLLTLPNGSTQEFCYAESRRDLVKAQGSECDDLGLEEAGDWEEDEYETLLATNRSSEHEAKSQLTANPGGRGHAWLKRRFVHSNDPTRGFIQSLLSDNPALVHNDPNYKRVLENIKNDALRRAWLLGDWDITAGTYFTELNRKIHLIEPFKIPLHWKWFGGYDYGFNHPAVWSFWVSDEDGNSYLVKEIYKAGLGIADQAKAVHDALEHFVETGQKSDRSIVFQAGHDCWAKKKGTDPTIAEDFIKLKIVLVRANISRVLGAKHVREYLTPRKSAKGVVAPRAYFFNTCPKIFDCLERMVNDPDNLEDVLKVDSVEGDPNTGDDGYDGGVRYPLMSRPSIANKLESPTIDRYKKNLSRKSDWMTA